MRKKLHLGWLSGVTVVSIAVGLLLLNKVPDETWWSFSAFVTGVVMVYLLAVEHMLSWPICLVNVVLYTKVFYDAKLPGDASLQVFYFVLGVYGWIAWAKGGEGRTELRISRMAPIWWVWLVSIWIAGTALYMPVIKALKGAQPLIDATLTVASIIGQVLQNHKKFENWMIWFAVDLAYLPLYVTRGYVSAAVFSGLLFLLAIGGYMNWSRLLSGKPAPLSPSLP